LIVEERANGEKKAPQVEDKKTHESGRGIKGIDEDFEGKIKAKQRKTKGIKERCARIRCICFFIVILQRQTENPGGGASFLRAQNRKLHRQRCHDFF
jgi:hypothetical protein